MKRKGQYTVHVFSCVFCEIFKKTFFAEDIRATVSEYSRINMFPFKDTNALFSFSSTIDENTDTVHLIEGFVF